MKKILILIADIIIVYASILLAFILLKGEILKNYEENFNAFVVISPFIGIMFIVFSRIFGLFESSRQQLSEVIYTVWLTSASVTIGIMAACFFIQDGTLAFPRSVILTSALFYGTLLSAWHSFEWRMTKKAHGIKDIVVVGKSALSLAHHIQNTHSDIYNVKYICEENDPNVWEKVSEVSSIFVTSKVSETFRESIFHYAVENEITIYFIPKYTDISIINASLYRTDDVPTFRISKMRLTIDEIIIKRAFDVVLSSVALIVSSPVFLFVSLLNKLDGGPVFYTQERLTQGGRIFRVFKFRSMVPNAEQLSGPVLADDKDPRITRIGRLLRATRMDELPQLINIINGDMSIVGPRPERPFFVNQFTQEMPEYHHRLKVKAGLTGLAQIMGKYNTHVSQKLRYDLIYINNYSVMKDVIIMLQTVKILFMKSSTEGVAVKQTEKKKEFELHQTTIGQHSLERQ